MESAVATSVTADEASASETRKPRSYYFSAYDPGTLDLLRKTPADIHNQGGETKDLGFIADQFPAFMTHKRGVSLRLMDVLYTTMGTGTSFEQIHTMCHKMTELRYARQYDAYLSYELANKGETSVFQPRGREFPPQPFSSFDDPAGYSGRVPSASYLLAVALAYHRFRRPTLIRRLMMVTGTILKGDMSFKLAKKIRCDRTGQYVCVFSIMNEHGEVLAYFFCRSKSLRDLTAELKMMQLRWKRETGGFNVSLHCVLFSFSRLS